METVALIAGHRYRTRAGKNVLLAKKSGRGRNRSVKIVPAVDSMMPSQYMKIRHFAAIVTHDLGADPLATSLATND